MAIENLQKIQQNQNTISSIDYFSELVDSATSAYETNLVTQESIIFELFAPMAAGVLAMNYFYYPGIIRDADRFIQALPAIIFYCIYCWDEAIGISTDSEIDLQLLYAPAC